MKKIEDYLHLYLPFDFYYFGYKYKVTGFKDGGHFFTIWHEHGFFDVLKLDFKFPLRPLSDMTEDEDKEFATTKVFVPATSVHVVGNMQWTAETFRWALSKHFDLFNLIDAGLAIDKTKMP